jgi:hypothetical protein
MLSGQEATRSSTLVASFATRSGENCGTGSVRGHCDTTSDTKRLHTCAYSCSWIQAVNSERRGNVHPKRRHAVTTQKTTISTAAAANTSNRNAFKTQWSLYVPPV